MKLSGVTSILVAASDPDLHNQIARVLSGIGAQNIAITDAPGDAMRKIVKESFQLVIVDQKMHRLSGVNLIQDIRSNPDARIANIPILVIVGTMTKQEIAIFQEIDFIRPLKKPFSDTLLASKIFEVLTTGDISTAHSRIDTMDYNQFTRVVSDAIRNNQSELAEEFILRRTQNNDKSPRLHNLLAQLRFSQGRIDEAFSIIERILETNPDFLPALTAKAKISVKLGMFEEALEVLEYAQKISPLNTQRLLSLGELHLGYGRHMAAKEKFKRALDIYPELERAKIGLARIHAEQGEKQKAQEIMQGLTDPMVVVSELNLKGVILAKSGRFKEAAAMYQKAINCSLGTNTDASICYNLALSYFKDRRIKEADEYIQRSVELAPNFKKAQSLRRRIKGRNYFSESECFDVDFGECILTDAQIQFLTGTAVATSQETVAKKVDEDDIIDYERFDFNTAS